MARIRTIKPSFWKHEDLSELPEATHMLAAALLNYADDEGYFNANPRLIHAECFPLREPSVSIPVSLRELSEVGYLEFFDGSDGKKYGRIVKFDDHQKVSHPTQSKIKPLCGEKYDSGNTPGGLTEASPPEEEGNKEEEREGKKRAQARETRDVSHGTPSPKKKTPRDALKEVLDDLHADAVIEHRKKIRKPLTVRAAELLGEQFARAPFPMTPDEAADLMILSGWQGFRPEYVKDGKRSSKDQRGSSSRVMDLVREVNGFSEDGDDAGRESDPDYGAERRRAVGSG